MITRRTLIKSVAATVFVTPSIGQANEILNNVQSSIANLEFLSAAAGSTPKTISGIVIKLNDALVSKSSPTIVWADEIFIEEELSTLGKPINLIARKVHFRPGSSINTIALSPEKDFPPGARAADGIAHGQHGANGENGSHGEAGGHVMIIASELTGEIRVAADGQRGGNAQGGGNGRRGARGADGGTCENGQTGGPGGNAGAAGTPGNGGDGGHVMIVVLDPGAYDFSGVSARPGKEGASAAHGARGGQGPGGGGGSDSWVIIQLPDCGMRF